MKKYLRVTLSVLFSVMLTLGVVLPALAATITTTPTGYTSAADVEYQYHTTKNYISNWGARGEVCGFLSPNAQTYYMGNYSYDVLSDNAGGTSQSNAPSSELYKALQNMMKAEHSYIISYQATRDLYKYTDCLLNDVTHISSFYSGKVLSGTWDSGKTWNREHTWPNSKGLGGSDEDDIMMLRPTSVSENTSRGNTAYGESSSYYDPGESVRGDCARIVLYVYVRWGNTSRMWGTSGVMESMDVLLKWMEEDPVDTWEMGRNDAVESITGVRNVFVDYPEYAWLLFGQEVPDDMTTPSGIAKNGSQQGTAECNHANTRTENKKEPTCTNDGYTGDVYCADCGIKVQSGNKINAKGHEEELQWVEEATCTKEGYNGDLVCKVCGTLLQEGQVVPPNGNHTFGDWEVVEEATDTADGIKQRICTECGHKETETLSANGDSDSENEDNIGESGGNSQDGSQDDTNQGNGSEDEKNETIGSNDPQKDSPDKKEIKKTLIVGTAIVVSSGCALGVGFRFFMKKKAVR